jgi:hypothetical protein
MAAEYVPEYVFDVATLPALRWQKSSGQITISGPLLSLMQQLDGVFLHWAAAWPAAEYRFPPFIPATELSKVDYLRSFPHLVTFPVALDSAKTNLELFTKSEPLTVGGEVRLTQVAPVQDVLTPAACYHFYATFQGETLAAPRHVTTCSPCFRREAFYVPLQRQWCFTMREIVCLGTAEEVQDFLTRSRDQINLFCTGLGLSVTWESATDPFFNPLRNPRYLWQRVAPVKTELVFPGPLALASTNFHNDYFGRTFGIHREGKAAFSGCVAFGLERWLYAWLACFGEDPARWPSLEPWTAPQGKA